MSIASPSPAIRILSLLAFAAGLAHARGPALLLGLAGLAAFVLLSWPARGSLRIPGAGQALRRLRWLLLALVFVYGWLTPGEALIPVLGTLSPSWQGLAAGGVRAVILLGMVLAVYLLLTTTPREQLLTGLAWLTRPLQRLGLDARRLNVRIVLTLQRVPQAQELIRTWQAELPPLRQWRAFAAALPGLWQRVLKAAENDPPVALEIPVQARPAWWEWAWPAGIALVMLMPWWVGVE
ncbi:hypothetical protein TspCOW1_10850 [Thiohalobacter sp. COW1]|uniref:ABC-type cobalt transporter, permease component CbiQ n=1 Tax=Thiohalobacter thiocyanaticus TaxID=585455 RepID=A0A1Z4VQM9_9GAMM|nr:MULTISPECIES: hypothetical protein [Thiohalobacter]BAZ93950.1 ABC-type cobalt transporter, permease component CbiQ [Thiohalobacter thiocyanaticus]BCO30982.1 hypothetical protein TspCOW1_10850 [Thiohalobacter sp. COW1]